MVDRKEKKRMWINLQLVKLRRVSAIGSLFLLILSNSLLMFTYVEHRNIHPYIGIPLIFIGLGIVILFLAHIYISYFEMYRTEKMAEKIYDPFGIYALMPYEEMWFRDVFIPMMESIVSIMPEGKEKETMEYHLDRVRLWVVNGIIPKDQFPEHLKKYYITDKQHRMEI